MPINFERIIDIARQAGAQTMEIYKRDIETYTKADESPLTEADLASHKVIVAGLKELTPTVPVLSEEAASISWEERKEWNTYWLIDPLDGTKEFIKKNGEFTVNIALIESNEPVWGVVYSPVLGWTYYGGTKTQGSFKCEDQDVKAIEVAVIPNPDEAWKIVGSRSHQSHEFKAMMAAMGDVDIVSMGSSLKLCLVAEGAAHLYPRLGLTSEWDTAAADAVLRGAGGHCLQATALTPITYNEKEDILNPWFICCSGVSQVWVEALKSAL